MSVLNLPRAHFRGVFVTDVGTANNNNVNGDPVLDVASVTLLDHGLTDVAFRRWMEEPLAAGVQFGTGLDKFEGRLRAGWNYYGDNSCYFQDVEITAVQLPTEATVFDHEVDALVGARVALDGAVMVDLNPAGETSTQIFCDQFSVLGDGGIRCIGHPGRMFSRWLKYDRNHGLRWWSAMSAVFQSVIPRESLESAGGSACLNALVEAGDGVCIRFCLYTLEYQLSLGDLSRMFEDGRHPHNPAVGRVIGTIGPWHADELRTVSLHRYLHPKKANRSAQGPAPGAPGPGHDSDGPPLQLHLGPTAALLDGDHGRLALDLITTFPERNAEGDKVDYGAVMLRAGELCLPLPPNDKSTYEATSGIVDIALTPAQVVVLARERLCLETTSGLGRLEESEVALESDDRCLYLDVGEETTIGLQALRRGRRLDSSLVITIDIQPWDGSPPDVVDLPETVTMPPSGRMRLPITGKSPGGACIRFLAPGLPTGDEHDRFDSELDSFVEVRVLPADTEIAGREPTFDLIAKEVLRYYRLLHPAMSEVVDLSSEEVWRDRSLAKQVLAKISTDRWEWSGYMPRTRDLSPGKRAALEQWCRAIINEERPDGPPGS